jgi:hypothetical protein
VLESYIPKWLKSGGYHPHMTVGKIESEDKYKVAIEETKEINNIFDTIVNKVSVEIIDENEDSIGVTFKTNRFWFGFLLY